MVTQFTKENIWMANKHMKKYTKSLVVRMQIETTTGLHDIPIRMCMGKLAMPRAGNPFQTLLMGMQNNKATK